MTDTPWVARHCIQCYRTPTECRICGCHDKKEVHPDGTPLDSA